VCVFYELGLAHALALPGCLDTLAGAFGRPPLPEPGRSLSTSTSTSTSFIDASLAENTGCRNTGPTLDQVTEALTAAARDQRMRALSIGEPNPTRCAGDPDALSRFVTSIARMLAATTD